MTPDAARDACPDPDVLADFLAGALPADRLDEVADHVEHCPRCADALTHAQPRPDDLLAGLADLRGAATASGEEVCRDLAAVQGTVARERADEPAESPPAQLGEYRLLEKIGEGGM